jgi:hypothetical protein
MNTESIHDRMTAARLVAMALEEDNARLQQELDQALARVKALEEAINAAYLAFADHLFALDKLVDVDIDQWPADLVPTEDEVDAAQQAWILKQWGLE